MRREAGGREDVSWGRMSMAWAGLAPKFPASQTVEGRNPRGVAQVGNKVIPGAYPRVASLPGGDSYARVKFVCGVERAQGTE